MTAEAIARLRALLETPAYVDAPLGVVDLFASDLRALLDAHAALETAHTEALDALDDLVSLAGSAMAQANNDGAEYDAKAELEDALAVLAKAGRR